ncbi:TcdA/TcdB catalytic glycosyltransferase domain-containing protein [Vibrio aestuarianus]|uniref:TcdA/TcdB catalytic glycosyltransferase domain-containing protein n=1 Tax=Vibrio aestuarianus TaxID=28171 RepID=UPI00237C69B4|nr:TcdA/TcdB catalytic glycosyltransferase domain-containing protein [Vibrio aestuarianus]MDE1329476.1 hypothetical protein [Vibrio aestuarianus]
MIFDKKTLIKKEPAHEIKAPKLSHRSFFLLNRCVGSTSELSKKNNLKEVFHQIVSTANEIYELDGYYKAIEAQDWLTSNLTNIKTNKVEIPSTFHFVWFGEINSDHVNHIKIWEKSNTKSDVNLWYDSKCFLSHEFHKILKTHCKKNKGDTYEHSLLKIQNEAYRFIKKNEEVSFDEACIRFLVKNGFCDEFSIREKLITIRDSFENYCYNIKKFDFSKVIDKENDLTKWIYELEMYLRGNLAAASDIARLVILRMHGGLYVDVDTLPDFGGIFDEKDRYKGENNLNSNKIVEALKVELILTELYDRGLIPFKNSKRVMDSRAYKQVPSYEHKQIERFILRIKNDVKKANDDDFFKSKKITKVYKNLATISTKKDIEGVFYSNIIGCEKGSKFIKILLREMLKRYEYINKRNCIFLNSRVEIPNEDTFYSRFLEYRFDEFKKSSFVTIPLSGPGLIVEVMLGISYNILKLDSATSPMFISRLLQNEIMGVGFHSQFIHTPESLDSSWMLKCN